MGLKHLKLVIPILDMLNNLLLLNSFEMDFFLVHFAGTIREEGMTSVEG